MDKPLIVTALPQEFAYEPIPHDIPIVFTGLGKLNAGIAAMDAIALHKPSVVINFGTAGRLDTSINGLVEIAEVLQRDMMAEPLAPRGRTPFDDTPYLLESGFKGVRCATGDSFVTAVDPWLIQQNVQIVDMELFALALVCHRKGIAWRSFKYITDNTDDDAGDHWQDKVHHGRDLFLTKLDEIF
ncbi:MAG: 5'-methylthioadenosine nucleosidase [Burkholderiaceae bacterium]|nr:5'-methylthioadenosine nucleosidase [Burkholderiaceae bacterium]MCD8517046.1 5'-methylthioadenosine nucleosidase [Burkholderiaceae bacterium]MCD8536907.1 5'-methylthioadenosine nucleosidase [Burkholderiaceae bacterium]MCD8566067.1 5'-methylthioadenosine nucleosidase [Burkholderiaceae bacterium]